mgnify:FL=1
MRCKTRRGVQGRRMQPRIEHPQCEVCGTQTASEFSVYRCGHCFCPAHDHEARCTICQPIAEGA